MKLVFYDDRTFHFFGGTATLCGSSLYRSTELPSRIRYENRGIFYYTTFSVVDQFFPSPQNALFFPDKVGMGSKRGRG